MSVDHQSATNRSGLALAGRRGLSIVLFAVSTAIAARALGVVEFGGLAVAGAVYAVTITVSDFGIGAALAAALGTTADGHRAWTMSAIRIQAGWATGLVAVTCVLALVFEGASASALWAYIPAIAVSGLSPVRQLFLARYWTGHLARIDLSTTFVQFALVLVAALTIGTAWSVALATASTAAVNTVWVAISGLRRLRLDEVDVSEPLTPSVNTAALARKAAPLGLASVLSTAYLSADLVLIGAITDAQSTGRYGAAAKMMNILISIPGVMITAAVPGLAATRASGGQIELANSVWRTVSTVTLPVCVGIALAPEAAVTIAFGADFSDAAPLVRLIAVAAALSPVSALLDAFLIVEGRSRAVLGKNAAGLAYNVGANCALLPIIGVIAAAINTVVTELVSIGVGAALLRGRGWLTAFAPPARAFGVLSASAGVGLIFLAAETPQLVAGICFAVLYSTLMTAFRLWPFLEGPSSA